MSQAAQDRFVQIEDYLAERLRVENTIAAPALSELERRFGSRIADAASRQDMVTMRILTDSLTALRMEVEEAAREHAVYTDWITENSLDELQEATPRRVGLFWGVAGGVSWSYPNAVFESGHVHRVGLWTTLSYEGTPVKGQTTFTPMAVVRYLGQRGDSVSSVVDAGGRFVLSSPTYSASLETVLRLPMEEEGAQNLYRIAGIVEYQLREDLWLTSTFGRDYQSRNSGSLIAQLGLKFHVTEDRYKPKPGIPGAD
jgi:hypothetical protein